MVILKLICTLIGAIIIVFVVGANAGNQCDVDLVFYHFENVPVATTAIVAFAIGALFTIPFAFFEKEQKRKEFMNRFKQRQEAIRKRQAEEAARIKARQDLAQEKAEEKAARLQKKHEAAEKAALEKAAIQQAKEDAKKAKEEAKLLKKNLKSVETEPVVENSSDE